ncbi:hypothetical protein LIER_41499 [Lithospermum erythrorhizon]|uniref:Bulb-type lectin domain-containing protein n=1 Tax=Lithospermum erythrorhizon TaxID=34254 RepID=A0AAV3RBH6_LITER
MDLVWKLHFALIVTCFHLAASFQLPQTGKLPSAWFNDGSGNLMTPILVSGKGLFGTSYTCGFFNPLHLSSENFFFGVVIAYNIESSGLVEPELVWHANQKPVKINATLQLTSEGDLILRDVDGTLAWSSNTTVKFVVGLNMSSS